jgi:hypothetical protein
MKCTGAGKTGLARCARHVDSRPGDFERLYRTADRVLNSDG